MDCPTLKLELVTLLSPEQFWLFSNKSESLALKELVGTELTVTLLKFGFPLEKIQMGRSPDEMKVDDVFSFGRMVHANTGATQ